MPIYKYKCESCEFIKESLEDRDVKSITCIKCGAESKRLLPTSVSSVTMETKDVYRGKKLMKGQKEMMTKRLRDHHARHEVQDNIEQHGINEAIRHGWTKKIKRT